MTRYYENYDPYFPDQPVVDLYLPIWASQPAFKSKPAFTWVEDGSATKALTYSELNSSAQSISSQLLSPMQRGNTVLILCPPGLQLVQIIFGCQRAGLLSVPIVPPDPSFTKDDHHHFIRALSQTKPKAAIAHQGYITSVQRYISSSPNNNRLCELLQNLIWVSVDDLKHDISEESKFVLSSYNGCKAEDVYLIQYTSGATGIPKPVLVTAGAAAHNVRTARKAYDLHPNSVIASWLPQYHDCGLMFLLLTVISGATCVLASPFSFVKRPQIWLEMITKFRASCTPVPSFALPLVLRRGGLNSQRQATLPVNLSSLRNLVIINEPIYRELVEEFVQKFASFGLNPSCISASYGLAENCTFVSTAWRKPSSSSFPNVPTYNKLLPSAKLSSSFSEGKEEEEEELNETDIIIVNEETNEPVEDGIEGEIWVSSPSNATGYLDHPYLTSEVFQGRLKGRVSKSYVRTGDRGIIRGIERYLYVTGRSFDVIRIPNHRQIHPHYIETAAYKICPEVLRGGCIAAFEISKKVVVVADLQSSSKGVNIGALRGICEGIREAVWKEENVEVELVVLAESGSVPKTTSGKIRRWLTKDKLLRGELEIVMSHNCSDAKARGEKLSKRDKQGQVEGRRRATEERKDPSLSSSYSARKFTLLSLL